MSDVRLEADAVIQKRALAQPNSVYKASMPDLDWVEPFNFASRLLQWFDQHGRHDLPWQHPRTPYRVWLSEVMLQQTQVQTVIPYFLAFLQRFPDIQSLATADLDTVLAQWSGLGYYSRARNLHRAAQLCVAQHAGELPQEFDDLLALPGIGRSTAGAILAQAHGRRFAILDGNVRRVLARYRAVAGLVSSSSTQSQLWALSQSLLPQQRLADYTQALMDLGASICTQRQPRCGLCPLSVDCAAQQQQTVHLYPQPKPRKLRPLRQCTQLWVMDAQCRLLLQRRPPVGVWAGLWSLPEAATAEAIMLAMQAAGLALGQASPLSRVRHEFTHYSLDIEVLKVAATIVGLNDQNSRWVSLAQALESGLPQPLRRLIETQLQSSSSSIASN